MMSMRSHWMCTVAAAVVLGSGAAGPAGSQTPAAAPSESSALSPLAQVQSDAGRHRIIDDWIAQIGREKLELTLSGEGRFTLIGPGTRREGTFRASGRELILEDTAGRSSYQLQLAAGKLTLSGADLAEPVVFTRQRDFGNRAARLFQVAPDSSARKWLRILMVLVIVAAAWLATWLLKQLSRFVIQTDWGPFRLIYRTHKNRAMTIHTLALNVIKYVVYFTALGYVLGELGVNYTAYLASLSVIGLAIGFGSQGLVQDTVTGFFIILENQYDVGDMVEISGQVGVVHEIGLRMTRLRNYVGQMVVIPNRNIAVVGNFTRGAQEALVDVAVEPANAAGAGELLAIVAGDVAREFDGVVLAGPRVAPPRTLPGGGTFLRIELSIWPGQPWVVEAQLVPRIRQAFSGAGLSIPGDRVVTFYHVRQSG